MEHQTIEKSINGNTKTVHSIYFLVDNPKTLAAKILLRDYYISLDETIKTSFAFRMRKVAFSRAYLTKVLCEKGDLKCSYCSKTNLLIELEGMDVPKNRKATIDHIIPISKGGEVFSEENVTVSCYDCNNKKGSLDLKDFEQIAISKKERKVIIDGKSHIHGDILPIVREALKKIDKKNDLIKETIVFDRVIGLSHCVEVNETDEIYYHTREKRRQPSKMVSNRQPEPSNELTIVMVRNGKNYRLLTAYIGKVAEPEPWDEKAFSRENNVEQARKKAIDFWSKHALIRE